MFATRCTPSATRSRRGAPSIATSTVGTVATMTSDGFGAGGADEGLASAIATGIFGAVPIAATTSAGGAAPSA